MRLRARWGALWACAGAYVRVTGSLPWNRIRNCCSRSTANCREARSELSRTLRRNFHALRERIGQRPDYAALARIFAEHGVVDRNGNPPSRHALRKAWGRLLRAMEAAERKRS